MLLDHHERVKNKGESKNVKFTGREVASHPKKHTIPFCLGRSGQHFALDACGVDECG
jgi:hypothetical protein